MFNKIAKVVRWSILFGMLYTLYSVTIKDTVKFENQTDEKVLLQMAKDSSKSKELFQIRQQLAILFPQNKEYQEEFKKILKQQSDKLLEAHNKMLIPVAIGNYRYVKNIEFGKDKNGKFVLIFNMTELFDKNLDKKTQLMIKKMLEISHQGIYEYYGFKKGMKLLLVPTFDN